MLGENENQGVSTEPGWDGKRAPTGAATSAPAGIEKRLTWSFIDGEAGEA